MSLIQKIKDFGSKVINTIKRPRFDFSKLPKINPVVIKPYKPAPRPNISPEQLKKNRELMSPALPVLKVQPGVSKPDLSKLGKGARALTLTPEQGQKIKEAIAKGKFK